MFSPAKGQHIQLPIEKKTFQNSNQFLEIPRTILFHEIAVAFVLLRSCRSMVPSPFVGLLSILRRRFLTEQRTIFHLHDQTNFSLFSELISSVGLKIEMFALIWYTTEEMTISCFPIFLLNGTFTTNFTLQAWERNPHRETWWFGLFRSEATQLLNLHDKNKISTLVISLRDWSTRLLPISDRICPEASLCDLAKNRWFSLFYSSRPGRWPKTQPGRFWQPPPIWQEFVKYWAAWTLWVQNFRS